MAIVRTAGTEIIRSIHFEDLTGDATHKVIIGEQHHIYTVLSITICAVGVASSAHYIDCLINGYDSFAGTTNQVINIFRARPAEWSTFVFNDKFSFTGHEPTDFAGPMDDVSKQNAISAQGSSVSQQLRLYTSDSSSSTKYDVTCTYIDQNNE